MEKDEVAYDTSCYGMEINAILRSTQQTKDIDEAVKDCLDNIYSLIDDEKFEQAESAINDLENMWAIIIPNSPKLRLHSRLKSRLLVMAHDLDKKRA